MTGVVNFMQTWISNCEVSEINDLKKAFDKNPEIHAKWVEIDSKKIITYHLINKLMTRRNKL